MTAGEHSQTLDRGVRLLEAVAACGDEGVTVSELAAQLHVSRPAVYRLLATLERHALIDRRPGGRARLGLGVLPLARAVQPLLRNAALPVLGALAEELGATAHLTVADGDQALAVVVVEPSWTDFHVAYRVGSRHPLDRGAGGRAISGARAGSAVDYVVSEGELQPGAIGVAAPVLGVPGLEASVGLVALGAEGFDAAAAGPRVVRAAAAVAAALT